MSAADDQAKQDAALFAALNNDPGTRPGLLRLLRQHDPKMPLPELDVEDRVSASLQAALSDEKKRNDELQKRVEKVEFDAKLRDAREGIVRAGLVTEAEMPEVEKLITEEHFPNHVTAARFYAAQKALTPPSPENYYGAPLDDMDKDFLADPDAAADKVAHDLVNQYMQKPGIRVVH